MILPVLSDTITALATPAGSGAIAIIRISGKNAFTIADRIFYSNSSLQISNAKSHTIHLGFIKAGDKVIDEGLVAVFRSPSSYTGEDVIEISCHGSTYIQQRILETIVNAGARLAQAGEFTLRAFLNGKMDLSQAEAVADLIAADSSAAHLVAMQHMRGGYSGEIHELREQLIHFASLLELELDFSEEDVEFANRSQLKLLMNNLVAHLTQLITSFELGNVIRNGVPVVIAGKPNAGKSTLLNALLNEERAIVTEIAGTTRDTIEEQIVIDGIAFRFIDTAGIRSSGDLIESIGVSRTFEKITTASVIIYLFDPEDTGSNDLAMNLQQLETKTAKSAAILPVANKLDKYIENEVKEKYPPSVIYISAKNKGNINGLKEALVQLIHADKVNLNDAIVTNTRHFEALTNSRSALKEALHGLDSSLTVDLIASNIRTALYHLGQITGEVTTDDLLTNIFSRFCIGK